MKNVSFTPPPIQLTEKEEIILYMLISNYAQQDIAQLLKCSRSEIVKIIVESLCAKFELPILSTKLLIHKAIAKGYSLLIPDVFFQKKAMQKYYASWQQLTSVENKMLGLLS